MYEPAPAEFKIVPSGSQTVVAEVLGEHDTATKDDGAELFGRLIAEYELVIVDLTETQFIDSSFLRNLSHAQRTAQEKGHKILVQMGAGTTVKRTLEISGFLTHFEHVSSRDEALAWAAQR
jgi:anti-anti-sigma factor